jgi:hypothetical protein
MLIGYQLEGNEGTFMTTVSQDEAIRNGLGDSALREDGEESHVIRARSCTNPQTATTTASATHAPQSHRAQPDGYAPVRQSIQLSGTSNDRQLETGCKTASGPPATSSASTGERGDCANEKADG